VNALLSNRGRQTPIKAVRGHVGRDLEGAQRHSAGPHSPAHGDRPQLAQTPQRADMEEHHTVTATREAKGRPGSAAVLHDARATTAVRASWGMSGAHACYRAAPASFDHLVVAGEQAIRQGQAERLGGFKVDEKLEPGGLLDREVARLARSEVSHPGALLCFNVGSLDNRPPLCNVSPLKCGQCLRSLLA
jgi:hypothetical protein